MSATEKLEILIGAEGVARLAQATVIVLGCGGVGSNCAEALVRGGIGNLVLVDRDDLDLCRLRACIGNDDGCGEAVYL